MALFKSKKTKEEVLSPRQIAIADFLKKRYADLTPIEKEVYSYMYDVGYVYAGLDGMIHTTERGQGILEGRIKYKPGVPYFLRDYMETRDKCTDTDGSQS